MSRFYVYVHRYASGPKEGQVFYVGRGSGRRYLDIQYRSEWWYSIVRKYSFTSEKVLTSLNEVCAFSLEVALISYYGRHKLCNLTNGGEGCSGAVRSVDTRLKLSNAQKGKPSPNKNKKLTAEHKAKISASKKGSTLSEEQKRHLSKLNSGHLNPFYGRSHTQEVKDKLSSIRCGVSLSNETKEKLKISRAARVGVRSPSYSKDIHIFSHIDGDVFRGTQFEFYTKHSLPQANVSALVRGVQKTCKGWRLLNE